MLISLKEIKDKYNMNIRGVLHIGGHYGEESKVYNSIGIQHAIFFEPMKSSFDICKEAVEKHGYEAINIALGSSDGEAEMFTETVNQGQSSSILKPSLHLEQYEDIVFDGRETVRVVTLDSYLEDGQKFNFINMDVQGYELEVLRGATGVLKNIDYIYSEVNRAELYENCARVEDLDDFLDVFGFVREYTDWAGQTWGDALYIRKDEGV
jgi:FkbM family methyltransferase